jgi:hypothetical protein
MFEKEKEEKICLGDGAPKEQEQNMDMWQRDLTLIKSASTSLTGSKRNAC